MLPFLLTSLMVVAGLSACGNESSESKHRARLDRNANVLANYKAGKDIHLAVVWDSRIRGFIEGAQLAMEEYNAEIAAEDERSKRQALAEKRPPPALAHRLVLDVIDESAFTNTRAVARTRDEGSHRNALGEAGTQIAKAVLSNPNVLAVVGHMDERATLSAMLAYQKKGVLLLAGNATDTRLEWMSSSDFSETFGLYFQLRPTDETMVQRIAQTFVDRRWSNVYLAYENTSGNESLLQLLTSEFAKRNIRIHGSIAFRPGGNLNQLKLRTFQNHFTEVGASDVDAIVLLAPAKVGAEIIKSSRGLGVLQPFVGTGAFLLPDFIEQVGPAGNNTLVTTLYRKNTFVVKRFEERFTKRFPGLVPDETAAMGYDSVRLYVEAVARAQTVESATVSHVLRFDLPVFYGLLGSYVLKDGHSSALSYHLERLSKVPNSQKMEYVKAD